MLVQWCRAEPWQWLQVGETGARSSHCELQPHHPRRKHSRDKDIMISYFSNEMEVKGCASPARPDWRTKWGPVSTRQHKVCHWIPRPVWKAVTRLGPRSIIISFTNNWSAIFTIAHYLNTWNYMHYTISSKTLVVCCCFPIVLLFESCRMTLLRGRIIALITL